MKNKTLSVLLAIASAVLLYASTNSGFDVLRGRTTLGSFFTTVFIVKFLATLLIIISGYLALKNSKKLKTFSKKTNIFLSVVLGVLIIGIFATIIPKIVDSIMVMGDFKKLLQLFLIIDISILFFGFLMGAFLTGVINKNIVVREKNIMERSQHTSGNTYRYIFSFLIPFIGYILGAVLLSKDDETEKTVGKNCIILGIISAVIGVVAWLLLVGSSF